MRTVQKLRVYNRDGDQIAEGTVEECAEQLHMTVGAVRWAFYNQEIQSKYRIIDVTDEPEQKQMTSDIREAIQRWDDFVTPIREFYGVPRYRGNQ